MAIHQGIPSMLQESLSEILLVAKYCIEYRKDTNIWPAHGCYGYPATLLLLSIADSIGSYVENGNVKNHFKILNSPDYYGLSLTREEIDLIYNHYRNVLSHNAVITPKVVLDIGAKNDLILQDVNGRHVLRLVPFYIVSVKAVNYFLNNHNVLKNNQTMENIYKKR